MSIDDKFWNDSVGKLRCAMDLDPLSLAEAEKMLAKAVGDPLTQNEVERMTKIACGVRSEPA